MADIATQNRPYWKVVDNETLIGAMILLWPFEIKGGKLVA